MKKATMLDVSYALKYKRVHAQIPSGEKCDLKTDSPTKYYGQNASKAWCVYQNS